MALDTSQVDSPGWWFSKLYKKLNEVSPKYDLLDSYYRNTPPLPTLINSTAIQDAYKRLVEMAQMNYAELAVEAIRERMNPNGFLLNRGKDKTGSSRAWDIWQQNKLDAQSMIVHRAQLSMGKSFVIVGLNDGDPLITCEDPRQVIVATNQINQSETLAGLKVYLDDNYGIRVGYLYLPGIVYRLESTNVDSISTMSIAQDWNFVSSEETGIDVVPIVPFTNNPDAAGRGYGEYERHIPLLNRINYTIMNRLEIATMQTFLQRAISGVPDVDAEGNEIDYSDVFRSSPSAMWIMPEGAQIWESRQVDLSQIRSAVKDDVQDFAAVTRTPLFYLTPEANNGSAEGASLAREGLIFKTLDRIRQTSESWEQVISLAFLVMGDTKRAAVNNTQVLWDDPQRFTLAEKYDAAVKAQAAGVPWAVVMQSVLQFTPQEIEQMAALRAQDALQAAALASPPIPTVVAPAGAQEATQAAQVTGGNP